jgi:hypothetical protein
MQSFGTKASCGAVDTQDDSGTDMCVWPRNTNRFTLAVGLRLGGARTKVVSRYF